MSYYTGQGDYYSGKGDPGLFSVLGGVAKGVLGVAGTVLPGPLGSAARFGRSLFNGGVRPVQQTITTTVPRPTITAPATIQRFTPSPAPTPMGVATCGGGGNGCGSGYHLNKAYSYRHDAPPGSMCVRNRSMNPANAKALRRAIRRQTAFIGLAKRALKGTGYTIRRAGTRR